MSDKTPTSRVDAHLERADLWHERSEAAATEQEEVAAVRRQILHTLAAAEETQIAAGTKTRAELRASRHQK